VVSRKAIFILCHYNVETPGTILSMKLTSAVEQPAAIRAASQWLPFTPNRDFLAEPRMFTSAQGAWYKSEDGRTIFDASSGLFTTPAGHGRAEIADAVYRQILELDFTPSFLRSHPKSFEVAARVAELLPDGMDKVFFVNSGSEAVDTAMKIAMAYHRARREASKTMFVSRERSYHGVNVGGTSLAGMVSNRRTFQGMTLPVVHMRHTLLEENRFILGQPPKGAELAEDLQRMVDLYGAENIAACIVEPIAGSAGVFVPPVGYLERLREICTAHKILLIFDEVICGFGRTGQNFAAQSFDVTPDIITMAKAITNGCVPMGAVGVSDHLYETILGSAPDETIEFFHGYTWSSHPVACAASMAALDIYRNEDLFERARELSPYFLKRLDELAGVPGVIDVRGFGMLASFEIDPRLLGLSGYELQKRLFDRGVHLKTTGNNAILAPPFIATREDLDYTVDILKETLNSTH
jgi:beta-alanine--pyruvate transaminase